MPSEDMSSFSTGGRHAFWSNKKTCPLVERGDVSSGWTRRHTFLLNQEPQTPKTTPQEHNCFKGQRSAEQQLKGVKITLPRYEILTLEHNDKQLKLVGLMGSLECGGDMASPHLDITWIRLGLGPAFDFV